LTDAIQKTENNALTVIYDHYNTYAACPQSQLSRSSKNAFDIHYKNIDLIQKYTL